MNNLFVSSGIVQFAVHLSLALPVFAEPHLANMVSLSASAKAPVIGAIKSPIEFGCGCYLELNANTRKNRKPVFRYLDTENPIAVMNIDGKDVKLRRTKERTNSIEEFTNNDVTTTLKYTLVKREYEGSLYDVKITVKRGKRSSHVLTRGYCGC